MLKVNKLCAFDKPSRENNLKMHTYKELGKLLLFFTLNVYVVFSIIIKKLLVVSIIATYYLVHFFYFNNNILY